MINKDYLKLIFAEKKQLMPLAELRSVSVPKYDELTVSEIKVRVYMRILVESSRRILKSGK